MSKLHYTIRRELYAVFGYSAMTPLLAQIIYWFGPSNSNGGAKTTIKRDGKRWIAKTKEGWGFEIERSVHQCKRALARLKSLEIIEIRRWRFKGQVMCHVWLNADKLSQILQKNGVDTEFIDSLLTMANQNGAPDTVDGAHKKSKQASHSQESVQEEVGSAEVDDYEDYYDTQEDDYEG